eukprot:TRINITY_DN869_c0_g1_i2.p1 TRINITY_DN869_c0_g1~~TRINITY_DN869_c0_g1_i2.p1  ORF type:complete len:894 (+),score=167.84 TRINITY_DN869_c0_g1_i2:57-2684(+)
MAKAAASPMADEATRAKWRRPTLNKGGISVPIPELPKGFEGCSKFKAFENSSFAESQDLEAVLKDWGVPTDDWGTGGTKKVCKFWDELVGNESGLEVWQKENGEQFLVRVTHVLRGKVSSPELYKRGMFLINTWQQFEDGRKRVRNGLLSEKLTIDEMPLEQNLHEVCERAVTEEEMQRVEDSICKIGPGSPAPTYDASYKCPLQVVSEKFIDHIIEIEKSKSYPGLLTVYHLYTVDIVCTGMPKTDFNTLEFTHADKNGERKLKYIHAWVWLPWTQIQRYLFEGSKLKESKAVNSFATDDELQSWLGRFFIPLDEWGTRSWKSVSVLHDELQSGSCHLECWGKEDGVPLVVRVAHVLQVKITSPELKHVGKFLFQTWHQSSGSSEQVIRNRPMSRIMSTADIYNNEKCFIDAAQAAVKKNIDYIADVHFRLDHLQSMGRNTFERADVKVLSASLVDHRTDLQESASFKDLITVSSFRSTNLALLAMMRLISFVALSTGLVAASAEVPLYCRLLSVGLEAASFQPILQDFNVSSSVHVPVLGDIDVSVSHLEIGAVRVASCSASVDAAGRFNLGVAQLEVDLKELMWKYQQRSFPHAADDGVATASTSASFNVSIDLAAQTHNVLKLRMAEIKTHLGAKHHSWLSAALDKVTHFMVPLVSEAVHVAAQVALDESMSVIHDKGACVFVQDVLKGSEFVKLQFTSYEPTTVHVPVIGDVNVSVNSTSIQPPTQLHCEKLAFSGTALSAQIHDVSFGAGFVWAYKKLNSQFWHNQGTGSTAVVTGAQLHIDLLKPSDTSLKIELTKLKVDLQAESDAWMYDALTTVMTPLIRESAQLFAGRIMSHFIAECIADPSCPSLKPKTTSDAPASSADRFLVV